MTTKTGRGRPADVEKQQLQKTRLLDAALALLASQSYRSISIREISEMAEMKSAMISYYFGSKEGLFIALIERQAVVDIHRMNEIHTSDDPIKAFICFAVQHFSERPELSRFISDEILSEKSDLGEKFIEIMPKQVAKILPSIIQAQQSSGVLRSDRNPKWLAFSLINMIVMPFVGAPVREKAWEISLEEVSSVEWAEHIYQLFMAGCQRS